MFAGTLNLVGSLDIEVTAMVRMARLPASCSLRAAVSERAAYAGLARTRPRVFAVLVVSFLSFVGIPPLAGFTAKLALFGAAVDAGYAWLAVLAVANTVASLF
mgnify:CR=1 FL=1